MSDVALRMEHIYKKFRKGEVFNSLRDLIPALTGRMFRQGELSATDKREFWALQDISFDVNHGEAFGIIGDNGAGKSTMLKILSRVMKPTKGNMMVNGRLSALLEVSAGFHPDLTGRENIFLNGTILGMGRREVESKLDQIIAFSGLEEFIDTPVKRYSSGMYARLGFSVAAHVDPEVLLVDEVLSVGDYLFQKKCVDKLQATIRDGATVLFVSHNLKTVADFCKRTLLLARGRTVALGPTDEVIASYIKRQHTVEDDDESKGIRITKVAVRNRDGECVHFQSGEKAWIDIEVSASKPHRKLSVSLYLLDSDRYLIFDTSLERLGYSSFDLEAGQVFRCTFELDLNLAVGTFYVSSLVFRYDNETEYASWQEAATFFVAYRQDVRGAANCFPRVITQEIREGQGSSGKLLDSPRVGS
jgi:lipopolysaccharide transport system ATP-binding protein